MPSPGADLPQLTASDVEVESQSEPIRKRKAVEEPQPTTSEAKLPRVQDTGNEERSEDSTPAKHQEKLPEQSGGATPSPLTGGGLHTDPMMSPGDTDLAPKSVSRPPSAASNPADPALSPLDEQVCSFELRVYLLHVSHRTQRRLVQVIGIASTLILYFPCIFRGISSRQTN